MKKLRLVSIVLLACTLFSALFLTSCGKKKFVAYSLEYFDTATTVTGYEKSQEEFDKVSGEIFGLLNEYHRLYNIYTRYEGLENLCTVNELKDGAHRKVKVDSRIIDMLFYAKEMYRVTGGKTNVAMGSVLSIWHDYRTAGIDEPWAAELPPTEALKEAAKHTNIDCIVIDRDISTVWISDPKATLDVGAVAKGYAVEMVAKKLEEQGVSGYVINVGGNVRTIGAKPDSKDWLVGIENPVEGSDEAYVAYLGLAGEAVVTSGSYQRYYTVDGKNYHHVIDPETLMPAEGFLSVSVVSSNSGQGDALSTALFCMTLDEGLALVESLDGVEAIWILPDGTTHTSPGFNEFVN